MVPGGGAGIAGRPGDAPPRAVLAHGAAKPGAGVTRLRCVVAVDCDKGVAASSSAELRRGPRAEGEMVTGFCISIETSGFEPEKPEEFEVTEVAMGP